MTKSARIHSDRPSRRSPEPLSADVFGAIFDDAGIGMAVVDFNGRPVLTNPPLREILGYSDEELRAMTFPEFTHPDDVDADWTLFQELLAGRRRRYQLEKRYIHQDGHVVHGRLTVTLVRSRDGSPLWAVGMVQDISELRETAAERKALRARLANAQEDERRRLAEDLHDDPVQKLTALGLRLGALAQSMTTEDQLAQVRRMQETVGDAVQRLRWLMFDLRPPALDREGLVEAVRQLLQRLEAETGWSVEIDDSVPAEPSPEITSAVYRIIQEALANARKHSEASEVRVRLRSDAEHLWGEVVDDGVGFDVEAASRDRSHLGLASMHERSALFGGRCEIESRIGSGAVVRFEVPVRPRGPGSAA